MLDYNDVEVTVKVTDLAELLTLAAGGLMFNQMMGGSAIEASSGASFSTVSTAVDDLVLGSVDLATVPIETRIVFQARAKLRAGEDEAAVDAWQEAEYALLNEAEREAQAERNRLRQAYTS